MTTFQILLPQQRFQWTQMTAVSTLISEIWPILPVIKTWPTQKYIIYLAMRCLNLCRRYALIQTYDTFIWIECQSKQFSYTLNDPNVKVRRYSRSDLTEPAPLHPPFQHQIRMQIRHLISQQQHKHHKRKYHPSKKPNKFDGNEDRTPSPTSPKNGCIPTNNNNIKFAKKDNYCKS
jgi:hypothetical protein